MPGQAELLPGFQGRLPPVPLSEAAKQACQAAMLGAASAKPMRRLLRTRNLLKVPPELYTQTLNPTPYTQT